MSIASFLDALASIGGVSPFSGSEETLQPSDPRLSEGVQAAVTTMVQASRPRVVLCLLNDSDAALAAEIGHLFNQVGGDACVVLVADVSTASPSFAVICGASKTVITYCSPGLDALSLQRHMQQHAVKVDALLFATSISVSLMSNWLEATQELAHQGSWILGPNSRDADLLETISLAASRQSLNLTFTADVWIASGNGLCLPRLSAPISGTVEPVRYGSISSSADEIWDRATFLQCVDSGVSGYRKHGNKAEFNNPVPANVVGQSPDHQAHFCSLHFPPYKHSESTEPHLIASLRDVRIAGIRGYLYTRNNELLEQSLGIGTTGIQALKEYLPHYEPILRTAVASTEQFRWNTMAGLFPPSVRLRGPHVVAMWPDTYIYHHWLVGCLTRFWYLDEYPELAHLPIVVNPFLRRYQYEYMKMLGLDKNRLVFSNDSVSLHLRQALYPTHVGSAPHSPQAIQWLRDKFIKHSAPVPVGYEGGLYYISRKDGRSREISNESEILEFLKPYGFQVVEWSAFDVAQQIGMAHHAKVIIGAHGSNMSNTIYINSQCKVLDIRNAKNSADDLTISAATMRISGQLYVTPSQRMFPHQDSGDSLFRDMSHDNYHVDFADFKKVFAQMMDA